jgi:hypothetical protein
MNPRNLGEIQPQKPLGVKFNGYENFTPQEAADWAGLDDNRAGATALGLQSRLRSEPRTGNAIF